MDLLTEHTTKLRHAYEDTRDTYSQAQVHMNEVRECLARSWLFVLWVVLSGCQLYRVWVHGPTFFDGLNCGALSLCLPLGFNWVWRVSTAYWRYREYYRMYQEHFDTLVPAFRAAIYMVCDPVKVQKPNTPEIAALARMVCHAEPWVNAKSLSL